MNSLDAMDARELRALMRDAKDRLARMENLYDALMNLRCDLSATAPEHHIGFKAGHRQARQQAAELIAGVLGL